MIGYGKELILDLHGCTLPRTYFELETYIRCLCSLIGMVEEDIHFWRYEDPEEYEEAPDHLKGTSVVQFIRTSNITVHTLDALEKVFINIFSCKDFDTEVAATFSKAYFNADSIKTCRVVTRL